MRYFWTFFWTFLLMQMLTYVISSMTSVPFDFITATILSVIVTLLIFVVSTIIPKDPAKSHS